MTTSPTLASRAALTLAGHHRACRPHQRILPPAAVFERAYATAMARIRRDPRGR